MAPNTNTLLSLRLMLATALRKVAIATPEDAGPFDLIFEFGCPLAVLTLPIDQFDEEILAPALDVALADKHPKGTIAPFAEVHPDKSDQEVTFAWEERGVFGRMRRFYDVSDDLQKVRVDILYRGVVDAAP